MPAAICENFNSIKVQLKRKCGLRDFFCFVFQFHKGTIKAGRVCNRSTTSRDFNSIKVQLKPSAPWATSPRLTFQFHKGTIKAPGATLSGLFELISIP